MSAVVLKIAVLIVATSPVPDQGLPKSLDLTKIRGLPVQHDGRWPPLDTAARDIVEEVTGNAFHHRNDPVLLLLAWTFSSSASAETPFIDLSNAELREELRLPAAQTVFSFRDLVSHGYLLSLMDALGEIERGQKLDPLESKVSDISSKLMTLRQVFDGDAVRLIPDPSDPLGKWRSIRAAGPGGSPSERKARAAWMKVEQAFLEDDGPAFAAASEELATALAALPAAHRPDPRMIAIELRYNQLQPFRLAWMCMVVGAVLSGLAMVVRRTWFDVVAILGLTAGFGVITYGLWLRWAIAGRIPASNMYESLLFLGWGMGAFAIVATFALRQRLVPLTASVMGALALVLADGLALDHYVRPIVPVLMDTIWMSIHVPVIMVSYAVLALGVLFAHVQLVAMAAIPAGNALTRLVDSLHYWYIHVGSILLLAGIVTGSMWAASSWGRYWGWDPKEVWSLVAFLGYLTVLHVRIDHHRVPRGGYALAVLLAAALFAVILGKFDPVTGVKALAFSGTAVGMLVMVLARGQFATALKSIVCFWLIIMTYVGVNYVLGIGLHSYGFGTGAMTRYLYWIGGIDLALAALCTALYVGRRPSPQSAGPVAPVAPPV